MECYARWFTIPPDSGVLLPVAYPSCFLAMYGTVATLGAVVSTVGLVLEGMTERGETCFFHIWILSRGGDSKSSRLPDVKG